MRSKKPPGDRPRPPGRLARAIACLPALLALLALAAACGSSSEPQKRWCGVKHVFGERIQYCFERKEVCEEQHVVSEESRDVVSCEHLATPWCAGKDECYPTEELCKSGVREVRSHPRESINALTGERTVTPPAGEGDPMPACTRRWPRKPIGMPD